MSIKMSDVRGEIQKWVSTLDPETQVPHLDFTDRFIRFGKQRKRFYFIGHVVKPGLKGAWIATCGDFVTEQKKILKSFDKEFEKENQALIYHIYKKKKEGDRKEFSELFKSMLPADPNHPYLLKKNVKAHEGVKVFNNYLMIPAYDLETNRIVSVEKIFELKDKDFFMKRHNYSKKGVYFPIGEISNMIFIAEGYATAATVHEVTEEFVAVSFGHHGLYDVALHFSKIHPTKPIIICADFKDSIKPQKEKDEEFQKLDLVSRLKRKITQNGLLNVSVIYPLFPFKDGSTDFNDLYVLDKKECTEQLSYHKSYKNFIFSLGEKDGKVFLYSTQKGLKEISIKVTKEELLLIADKDYWKKFHEFKGQPYWSRISEMILSSCLHKDFDYNKIRFAGMYLDKEGIVINTGNKIIGRPSDNYTYLLNHKNDCNYFPNPKDHTLNLESQAYLMALLGELNFKDKADVFFLMSWIAIAPFFRTLEFVPHLTINGQSSAGKSWIIDNFIKRMLKPFQPIEFYKGITLPAFLRKIKFKTGICFFEEMENTMDYEEWLNVFRLATTSVNPKIEKAIGQSGSIITYPCKFIGAVSSITSIVRQDQDIPRFLEIILYKKKTTNKNLYRTLEEIKKFNVQNVSLGMFNTMYENFDRFKQEYKDTYSILINENILSGHNARKTATLIASAKVALNLSNRDEQSIYKYIINKTKMSEFEISFEDIIAEILTCEVYPRGETTTVKEAFLKNLPISIEKLGNEGIRIDGKYFIISTRSIFVKNRVFRYSESATKNWPSYLKNNSEVKKAVRRFNGLRKTAFLVPLELCGFNQSEREKLQRDFINYYEN